MVVALGGVAAVIRRETSSPRPRRAVPRAGPAAEPAASGPAPAPIFSRRLRRRSAPERVA